ncbi:MAG: c-type cytochrome biogenesis protein CcsB [Pseudonocardia sp. SCN 72-86]|uniref:c-type cytochrome biogenesis protein CcsB n=1 Tax=uncultured Microbacterium sp. TaxID=191216 RepID=UPI00086BE114|nr:c-type cytochrome biogenesis protein CcsB [uncultured Microbacterium sp.]ODU04688.1 MAG: c-type cytochrome biogenesis protein CcsB [Pseudonocardia sp. SCN 72-86]
MNTYLDSLSQVALYSAIALYVAALISYLLAATARLSRPAPRAHVDAAQASSVGSVTTLTRPAVARARSVPQRAGYALTVIGVVFHLAALGLRAAAAGRIPWANMYEFSVTGVLFLILLFLVVARRVRYVTVLGVAVLGGATLLMGAAAALFYVPAIPLPPALQSAWLIIHVLVALLATAFFSLSCLASIAQLWSARTVPNTPTTGRLRRLLPPPEDLERFTYRLIIIGFILWTFTLIAGAIWAQRAWGRFWGWDVKEVWTFIIWVIYAAYIHAKATRGWSGRAAAWLAIIGYTAVIFNFGIVNVFFKGLHSYSGL